MMPESKTLDLIAAIEFYTAVCSQNLSLSEKKLIQILQEATTDEQYFIQRLYARRHSVFRKDSISYFSEEEQETIIQSLVRKSWLWDTPSWFSTEKKLHLCTTEELKIFCKQHKRRSTGKKQLLIERLSETGFIPALPIIILRNEGLLKRICAAYLRDHHGNLSTLILDRLNIQSYSFVPYQKTNAAPIHRTRREYQEYLFFRQTPHPPRTPTQLPIKREQFRFSALRFYHKSLYFHTQDIEKTDAKLAISNYQNILLQKSPFHSRPFLSEVYHRLALCLDRTKQPKPAIQILKQGLEENFDLPQKLNLFKTGRRIAGKIGKGFPLAPELKEPFARHLKLGKSTKKGNRIYYQDDVVELAVLRFLKAHGREGYWSENSFWNMLFSIVFLPAMFAPIDEMLPSSILRAPIDFQTKNFYLHRKALIDAILKQVQNNQAVELIKAREKYQAYTVQGIDWERYSLQQIIEITEKIPAKTICAVLKILLLYPESAFRGMPDLFILSGESAKLPKLFPSRIPKDFLFLEIKSPNDVVSIHQKVWFHHLICYEQKVEIWNIKE